MIIPKLLGVLVLFITLFFTSCEKDLYENVSNEKTLVNKISLEKFKQQTGINDFDTSIKIQIGRAHV